MAQITHFSFLPLGISNSHIWCCCRICTRLIDTFYDFFWSSEQLYHWVSRHERTFVHCFTKFIIPSPLFDVSIEINWKQNSVGERFLIGPKIRMYFSALFYKICHTFASVWIKMASFMIIARKERITTLPSTFQDLFLLIWRAQQNCEAWVFPFSAIWLFW